MSHTYQITTRGPAYYNKQFIDSDEGRPLRILSEYLEPYSRLKEEGIEETIVFFGSARIKETGDLSQYYNDAKELSTKLTQWAMQLPCPNRFVICSGGGGGIMEAANRGAFDAGGKTIGFNIGLPFEQRPNDYIDEKLLFEFHYFFMRKLWFSHLASALVVFPGGFGTLDELMETLTLVQTKKIDRKVHILIYGSKYWKEIINFEKLAEHKMISKEDLELIHWVDDVDTAYKYLTTRLHIDSEQKAPHFAKANVNCEN